MTPDCNPVCPPASTAADSRGATLKWLRLFLARNPFYILSAALLLWSMRRLSLDSRIFSQEFPQLVFNFSSFQFYELLLAGTAVMLARRRVYYDSGLLVALENLFVCVPFILVSQALLLTDAVALTVCLAGGGLLIARVVALKFGLKRANLPASLLLVGGLILAFNLGWPVLVRTLHQTRDLPVWDDLAGKLNFWEWNGIIPAFVALAWFFPMRTQNDADRAAELPFYSWRSFPLLALLMWIAGTSAHLYCINYVYTVPFAWAMLAPAMWLAAWIAWKTTASYLGSRACQAVLLTPIAIVLACAALGDAQRACVLAGLSVAGYAVIALRRGERFAGHLAAASLLLTFAFMPHPHVDIVRAGPIHGSDHAHILVALGFFYVAGLAIFSGRAKLGILGGLSLMFGLIAALPATMLAVNMAIQVGLAFILLHSLRWNKADNKDAAKARVLCAVYWMIHTMFWTAIDPAHALYGTLVSGGTTLAIYAILRLLRGMWGARIVAYGALAVTAYAPAVLAAKSLLRLPDGLLILLGSFALFAIGTLAALTKERWLPKFVVAR